MNRKPSSCADCGTLLRGKVHMLVPGLEPGSQSRLCVDCLDKYMEGHLSEERRLRRDSPSFRGLVSYVIKHYQRKGTARRGPATKESILKSIHSGALTVEDVLQALKESQE